MQQIVNNTTNNILNIGRLIASEKTYEQKKYLAKFGLEKKRKT